MTVITDWIVAISSAVSASAISFLWLQTQVLRKEMVDDHDRSRRELSVNLMLAWAEHLQRETSSARKLVENLTEKQCRDLLNEGKLQLDLQMKPLVETCLGSAVPHEAIVNGQFSVQESQTALLRWHVVRFLNTLEVIMAAWRHHAADRDMLTEQFRYLYDPPKGFTILEKFREIAGGKQVYPAIAEFADHVKSESTKLPEGLSQLGKSKNSPGRWSRLFSPRL